MNSQLPTDLVRVLKDVVDADKEGRPLTSAQAEPDSTKLHVWMNRSTDGAPSRPDLAGNTYVANLVGGGFVEVRNGHVYPTANGRAEASKYGESYVALRRSSTVAQAFNAGLAGYADL